MNEYNKDPVNVIEIFKTLNEVFKDVDQIYVFKFDIDINKWNTKSLILKKNLKRFFVF